MTAAILHQNINTYIILEFCEVVYGVVHYNPTGLRVAVQRNLLHAEQVLFRFLPTVALGSLCSISLIFAARCYSIGSTYNATNITDKTHGSLAYGRAKVPMMQSAISIFLIDLLRPRPILSALMQWKIPLVLPCCQLIGYSRAFLIYITVKTYAYSRAKLRVKQNKYSSFHKITLYLHKIIQQLRQTARKCKSIEMQQQTLQQY